MCIFTVSTGYNIRSNSAGYNYNSAKHYDIKISCTDGETTVYSNFQVYVNKNDPPFFVEGPGYLPGMFSRHIHDSCCRS